MTDGTRILVLSALQRLHSTATDNLLRSRRQFRGCGPDTMKKQYGDSGFTCQEILDGHVRDEKEIELAIAEIKAMQR